MTGADPYLDLNLADRSSHGCGWHFRGGSYLISVTRYRSLSGAKADFANACNGLKPPAPLECPRA